MPNPVRAYPEREEDQVWLLAKQSSDLTGKSFQMIYFFAWLDEFMDSFEEAVEFIISLLMNIGFPIKIDAADALPDEDWWNELRYAETPLFADSYELIDPETGEGLRQYWPNYDFIDGANKLVGTAFLLIITYFGGRWLIKEWKSDWTKKLAAVAGSIYAGRQTVERFSEIRDNFTDIDEELAEGDFVRYMSPPPPMMEPRNHADLVEMIRMLTIALDSNKNSDVQKLYDYVSSGKLAREPGKL
jgi:hypothetical protein